MNDREVEAGGTAGTVEQIMLFTTRMTTPDNKQVFVPNRTIIGGVIVNYSGNSTRRVDLVFGGGYGDDLRKVREVFEPILAEDRRVLKDPAPALAVNALGESSVDFIVRPWAKSSDYWGLFWDVQEKVKTRFDEAGLSIPFPQRDVHVHDVKQGA